MGNLVSFIPRLQAAGSGSSNWGRHLGLKAEQKRPQGQTWGSYAVKFFLLFPPFTFLFLFLLLILEREKRIFDLLNKI